MLIQNYIEYSNRKFHLAKSTEHKTDTHAILVTGDDLTKLDQDDDDGKQSHIKQVRQVSYQVEARMCRPRRRPIYVVR